VTRTGPREGGPDQHSRAARSGADDTTAPGHGHGAPTACPSCGLGFGGVTAFDRHRIRVPSPLDPDPPTNRCASAVEMAGRGLAPDDLGVWHQAPPQTAFLAYGVAPGAIEGGGLGTGPGAPELANPIRETGTRAS
jgi:hypothetical protein